MYTEKIISYGGNMNIQEFFNWMFSAKSEAAYLAMTLTGLLIFAAVVEMMNGFRRCAPRQLLHAILSFVSVVIAFITTEALIMEMHAFFESSSLIELLDAVEKYIPGLKIGDDVHTLLAGMDPRLEEMLLTLPAATIIAPIVFAVLYALANLILKIVFWIVSKLIPAMPGITSRVIGMMIGLAEGLLITAILYLPLVAATEAIDNTVTVIDDSSEAGEDLHALYNDYFGPINDSPVFNLTRAIGGEWMMNEFCTVDLGDGEMDMRDELTTTAVIIGDLISLKDADWDSINEEDKSTINHLISTIDSSGYYSEIFSGIFRSMSELIDNPAAEEGDLLAALVDDMLVILSTSEKDTVGEDLGTFKDLYFILSDEGVLEAFDNGSDSQNMLSILTRIDPETETTVISKLIEVVKSNQRTSPLLTTLTKLSVTIMAESMGLGEDAEELYEDIKTGVNDILAIDPESYSDPAEYEAAVGDSIETTLAEQGIELEREVIDEMASAAAEICRENDIEELTDEQISDILLKYYDGVIALPTP